MCLAENIGKLLLKFKYYGLRGAVRFLLDYIPARFHASRQHRFFIKNFEMYPLEPEHGITIIGDLTAQGSICKTLRDFVFSLKDAGIAFQTYDTCRKPSVPKEDVEDILTPSRDFRIRRYNKIVAMFDNPLPRELCLDVSVIYFWEFTSAFVGAHPESLSCTSIVGMSDFNVDYFKAVLPKEINVTKILYPFRTVVPSADTIKRIGLRYGLDVNGFKVFFNFALSSSFGRKNPDGAIRAFAEAFHDVDDAFLVFKIFGCDGHEEELRSLKQLAKSLGVGDRFVVISDYLSQEEIYALTFICDVYLSLHRGEGFGLGIAEAMSLGKSVVVTGWSANTEFCRKDNSVLVPYRIVSVEKNKIDHIYLENLESWAEPDIHAAAKALRNLYDDRLLCNSIGSRAKAFMTDYFSIDHFKKSVCDFIS